MTEVIDFKTKRMLSKHRKKQKEKFKDAKFDADWVAYELVKVINKSFDIKVSNEIIIIRIPATKKIWCRC